MAAQELLQLGVPVFHQPRFSLLHPESSQRDQEWKSWVPLWACLPYSLPSSFPDCWGVDNQHLLRVTEHQGKDSGCSRSPFLLNPNTYHRKPALDGCMRGTHSYRI